MDLRKVLAILIFVFLLGACAGAGKSQISNTLQVTEAPTTSNLEPIFPNAATVRVEENPPPTLRPTLAFTSSLPKTPGILQTLPNAATLQAEYEETSTPTPTVTTTLALVQTSSNCDQFHEAIPQVDANKLLVTYVHDGDVWLWRGSDCTSTRLTKFRNVYSTRFVGDDNTILFERLYPRPDFNSGGTGEVWAMDMEGNNQKLLLDRDELKDMYLERGWGDYEYRGLGLGQVAWIPDTKLVAFSTNVYFSELSSFPDDLRILNLETGDYTTLFKAREAGEFKISPNGENFAITTRDSISVFNWRTEEFHENLLTFDPIPCGCEGPHYIKPFWLPDSEFLLVAVPSDDFTTEDTMATLWKINVNPRSSENLGSYAGANRRDFFEELSSDLNYLVLYDYEQRTFNIFDLSREGQSQPVIELSGWFREWHPQSNSFLFTRNDQLFLGIMAGEEKKLNSPIGDYRGQEAHWINDKYFIHYYHSGDRLPLNSNIAVGSISGEVIHIISALNPNYSTLSFDFTMLP